MIYLNYMVETGLRGQLRGPDSWHRYSQDYLLEGFLTQEQISEILSKLRQEFLPAKVGLPELVRKGLKNPSGKVTIDAVMTTSEEEREYLNVKCGIKFLNISADEFYQLVSKL